MDLLSKFYFFWIFKAEITIFDSLLALFFIFDYGYLSNYVKRTLKTKASQDFDVYRAPKLKILFFAIFSNKPFS